MLFCFSECIHGYANVTSLVHFRLSSFCRLCLPKKYPPFALNCFAFLFNFLCLFFCLFYTHLSFLSMSMLSLFNFYFLFYSIFFFIYSVVFLCGFIQIWCIAIPHFLLTHTSTIQLLFNFLFNFYFLFYFLFFFFNGKRIFLEVTHNVGIPNRNCNCE